MTRTDMTHPMAKEFERFMRESNAIEGELDTFSFGPVDAPKKKVELPGIGRINPGDMEAMEMMYIRASDGVSPTEEALLDIHACLSEYRTDMTCKGKYRDMHVAVGGHRCPAPDEIQEMMNDYFQAWKKMDAWQAHCEYEKIHPFEDLNGRTGRILWAWKMLQNGKSPFSLSFPFLQRFYYQTLDHFRSEL